MKLSDITILNAQDPLFTPKTTPNKLTLSFLSLVIHSKKINHMCEDLEDEVIHTKTNYSYKNLRDKGVMDLYNWVKDTIKGYTASFVNCFKNTLSIYPLFHFLNHIGWNRK